MARIRTIKPGFFRHAELYEAERETGLPLRIAFAGLWTAADREGRFKWKPRELKLDCLPHDEVDFSRVLDALATRGFIAKYAVDGAEYGFVPTWKTHQIINNRETASELPQPTENNITSTCAPRVLDASPAPLVQVQGEGKGREEEGKGKNADASASAPVLNDEADYYRRVKEICGVSAGGLAKKLLDAKGGSIPLARAAAEQASVRQDPREYLGAIIRNRGSPADDRMAGRSF